MTSQSSSYVLSAQNVAFGMKLVSLCMILGLALLGVGTGLVLNLYVYASRYASDQARQQRIKLVTLFALVHVRVYELALDCATRFNPDAGVLLCFLASASSVYRRIRLWHILTEPEETHQQMFQGVAS
jgi:hypothetical protein